MISRWTQQGIRAAWSRPDTDTRHSAACSLLLICTTLFCACGNPNTPLDADTRQRIDSAATEQIRLATVDLDSHCINIRYHQMNRLVDSFRQVRHQEIEAQLKELPK